MCRIVNYDKLVTVILMAFALFILVMLTGCKTTSFEYSQPNGAVVKAKDSRLFMRTAANIKVKWDNVDIQAGVESNPAAEAAARIAESAVKGAVEALKKP